VPLLSWIRLPTSLNALVKGPSGVAKLVTVHYFDRG
jgi:hypothetical protein